MTQFESLVGTFQALPPLPLLCACYNTEGACVWEVLGGFCLSSHLRVVGVAGWPCGLVPACLCSALSPLAEGLQGCSPQGPVCACDTAR